MYHTVALQQNGTVVAWGLSDASQCTVPSGLALSTQVSAGGAHSMALTSNIARPTAVNATDGTSTANVTITWTAAAGAASGTDALSLALMAAGLRPGDEVLLPAVSFFATAGAALRLGLRPVPVDVGAGLPLLDPTAVAEALARSGGLPDAAPRA
jgi:DNA-binding transcriptional MocR family regulator